MSADNFDSTTQREDMPQPSPWLPFVKLFLGMLLGTFLLVIVVALFMPRTTQPRDPAPRSHCKNNLKQIGLALHNYHEVHGCFPPAYIPDKDGKPMHSWRVALLPYLDEPGLYEMYDVNEPWNGPNNSRLAENVVPVYRCPSQTDQPSTATNYLLVVGPGTAFPVPEVLSMPKHQINDGLSHTIMVVEVANSDVHWMEPRDLHVVQMANGVNPQFGQGISSAHKASKDKRGANVLFADGSARFLPDDLPPNTVRAMLTIDGGEEIPPLDP